MKRSDVTTAEILDAIDKCGPRAFDYLTDHYPPKVVRAAYRREVKAGRLACGVSLETAWVVQGRGQNGKGPALSTAEIADLFSGHDTPGPGPATAQPYGAPGCTCWAEDFTEGHNGHAAVRWEPTPGCPHHDDTARPFILSPGRRITDPDEAEALGMNVDAKHMRHGRGNAPTCTCCVYQRPDTQPNTKGRPRDSDDDLQSAGPWRRAWNRLRGRR